MQLTAPDILAGCHMFRPVPKASMARLVSLASLRTFDKSAGIFRQGDPCPGVFVVGSGLVRVYKMAPSGKEHVLHLVGPGGTFAEVAAIGGFPCPAFAEALEETTCAVLPTGPFRQALKDDHDLTLGLLMGMAGWVKQMVGMVEDIALRDAAGRLSRYLLNIARENRATLPSLKRHLASHLNLTSETLSRTLRKLGTDGLIDDDGDTILLRDPAALRSLAEGEGLL